MDVLNSAEMRTMEDLEAVKKAYIESNQEFKKKVDEINSKEELEHLEEDLMKIMDEEDEYIKKVQYELPKEVEFEGSNYKRSRVATTIKTFLERHEVEFAYVYGMYNLSKFWAGNPSVIDYGRLDSTLRLLEQLKFSGKDWGNILLINAFFQKSNNEYNKDLTRTLFLAERHNIILERMQLLEPVQKSE